ncbi:hypothetical protein RYH73_08255 [Olivibacter sp. CPCC 100613]|uniref:hypothetical protein n=1 Tax=Olivibacter sp. CPCC 100613 TaxID=3079931 RepID=UPI002FF7D693
MRNNRRKSLIAFSIIILVVLSISLSGWSLFPFGKRYLPDYFFDNVSSGIKGYVRPNERLILLNDSIFHPEEGKYALGVNRASTIVEYSRERAMDKFGDTGQHGAVEIRGSKAQIFYGKEDSVRMNKKMALLLAHNTSSVPSPLNLGLNAIHSTGEIDDTLFLGSLAYRLKGDTMLTLTPDNLYYVSNSEKKKEKSRRLLIYRYGKLDTILNGRIKIEGNIQPGSNLYNYNKSIAIYRKWAANTLVGVLGNRHVLTVNGKNIKEPLNRIQATGGSVRYLNGIEAVKKYGIKGLFGAAEVSGNNLKYFRN